MVRLLCTASSEELTALLTPIKTEFALQEQQVLAVTPTLYVLSTGIGPINASWGLGQALATLNAQGIQVEQVLVAGLAGAFDLDRNPLLTFCQVTEEIWPEYGLHDGVEVVAKAFKYPQWATSPQGPIYDRVQLADLSTFKLKDKILQNFQPEKSLSVAGVSASFARTRFLWDNYHAALENMEGFALAYGCLRAGIQCVELRCISNKIGPRKIDEKDFPGALARLAELLPTLNLI
ncbi:MAG: futalosine hydrolase [Desulfovibrionaceae bacterium]|nr:futalosine hydrolase [Desulfovibrionaceae bacterium]